MQNVPLRIMRTNSPASFLLLILIAISFSCKKDGLFTDTSAKLQFSKDTVLFDTVFTTVGSSTQWLQVHNPYNKKIKISSIRMGKGSNSFFRMNVNGQSGSVVKDVEIAAKDSIFIFVEVRVDPRNANNPMVVTDSIIFETNSHLQDVKLVAWGQDAYFHTPFKGTFFSGIGVSGTWLVDKPHVIYGFFLLDSATLTVPAGARIYIHQSGGIIVYKGATLKIEGTLANPVVIQGDRLESAYIDLPGQWDRIWFYPGSINNEINYAIIKNGNVGLQCDTIGNSSAPTLKVSNTIVKNMAGAGIYAQDSYVKAYNCVFANCGIHAALLAIGGDYSFYHCTFANFWSHDTRQTPLLGMTNYYKAADNSIQIRNLTNAYFGNCIFSGSLDKEIGFDYDNRGDFKYKFDYCSIQYNTAKPDSVLDAEMNSFPSKFDHVIKTKDQFFVNTANNDYTLVGGAAVIDIGNPTITASDAILSKDLAEKVRDANPDLGAYEK